METAISRTQFLRGDLTGQKKPVRPPWSVNELLFTTACNQCGDCIASCPTHIIKPSQGNFPGIDFSAGECLFCGDCADACKTGALIKNESQRPWQIAAQIDSASCMAYNNIECRSCYDPCEARAIQITPRIGGVSIPSIDESQCTGCGACHSVCPSRSISMQHLKEAA